MSITLQSFARLAHDILAADHGIAGREKLRLLLQEVLVDQDFIGKHVKDDLPQHSVLYHDPELNFAILAHVFHQARETLPHDHGSSWAIYGQVSGESLIHDWEIVEPAAADKPGKVRKSGSRYLMPGAALLYNEGDIHSPSREAPAKLIRIEGQHIQAGHRLKWEAV